MEVFMTKPIIRRIKNGVNEETNKEYMCISALNMIIFYVFSDEEIQPYKKLK